MLSFPPFVGTPADRLVCRGCVLVPAALVILNVGGSPRLNLLGGCRDLLRLVSTKAFFFYNPDAPLSRFSLFVCEVVPPRLSSV